MNLTCRSVTKVALAIAVALLAADSQGALINGPWVITNSTPSPAPTITDPNTASPSFAPTAPSTVVSGITIQSAFPTVNMTSAGDYVEVSGTVNLVRTANLTTANRLNDQIRLGLFGAPLPPAANASGDPRGFIAEYGTGSPVSEIRGLIATQANPFSGGAATPVITTAGADPEGNFLSGTPVAANFVLRVTRQAGGTIDITGNFSGVSVDPLDNDYFQAYSVLGHTPDASFNFSLNRLAILIGGNADAAAASFSDVRVTSNLIPEPTAGILALTAMLARVFVRRRGA